MIIYAWSEVAYDIIYKKKDGLSESHEMNHMLDTINSLSSE